MAARTPVRKRTPRTTIVQRERAIPRLPLASLRVFVAVAEHLSFTRAGATLGVTAAAVSMQIRALEEYLRQQLFRRRGRQVELTAEGARLLPRVREGLEQLERAINEARTARGTGPLTVSMLASFLQQWLMPRLPHLNQKHAGIDLRIHTSAELVDFAKSEVQAAIRFGSGPWPNLHVEKLFDDWLVPVTSPRLFRKHGPVASRADLERYRLIHSISEPWDAWCEGTLAGTMWGPAGASFDDSVACLRAAENDQGLALTRWSLVAAEIRSGRLALAGRSIVPMQRGYYFVCPHSYLSLEKVALFREWIVDQARAAEMPPEGVMVRNSPLR